MTAVGLTRHQQTLFAFIESAILQGQPAPSFDEMRRHMGLRSKSGIHRMVSGLEERGRIVRLRNRARSIALPGTASELAMRQAAIRDQQTRLDRDGDRLAVNLPNTLAGELLQFCDRARAIPSDVVATAIAEHMRRHS